MNTRERIYGMLNACDTTMLVTSGIDDYLQARPMAVAKVDELGEIWLLGAASSRRIDEIAGDDRGVLVFQTGRGQQLSVSGRARIVIDPAGVRRLWKPAFEVWFPKGPDDSEVVLVAIDPMKAEYWDAAGGARVEYRWHTYPLQPSTQLRRLTTASDGESALDFGADTGPLLAQSLR